MSEARVLPVSVLVSRIKHAVSSIPLGGYWIQGEVSNLTKHRSGHYYFSIKDSQAELSCVMFRSYVNQLHFSMEEGMSVLVSGDPNVYEQRGQLQFYVRAVKPDGIGALYLELEQRKRKLAAEGLFEDSRKKPRPGGIMDIAVVTAKEGAALQDVRATIAKRWPMARLTLYPATVQGKGAPASIAAALRQADAGHHQAILLVRGGGSFEDLFCFNDEQVVRTLADMRTFVVTGIGHEVDTTLADLAADIRAATPTAAAQYISADQYEVLDWIGNCRTLMTEAMNRRMDAAANHLMQVQNNPWLADPAAWAQRKELELQNLIAAFAHARSRFVSGQSNALAQLKTRLLALSPAVQLEKDRLLVQAGTKQLQTAMTRYASQQEERLASACSLLDAYSPLKVLARGYSLCTVEGHILTDPVLAPAGTRIQIRLAQGELTAKTVEE